MLIGRLLIIPKKWTLSKHPSIGSGKKKICVSKDTIKRVKIQPSEWAKTFSNHISL